MDKLENLAAAIAVAVACVVVGGCSLLAPRADPSRFFVLSPLRHSGVDEAREAPEGISLGLGPITVPAYLDRAQMVTRVGPNQVEFSESNRWAEPLETNFTRVLAQNLKVLLRTDDVVVYPWLASQQPDYAVRIDVLRFECDGDGNAQLSARWTIKDGQGKQLLDTRDANLSERALSTGAEGSVAALSAMLGDLSREIAAAVSSLRLKQE